MSDQVPGDSAEVPPGTVTGAGAPAGPPADVPRVESTRVKRRWFVLRAPVHPVTGIFLSALCIAACFGLWWFVTAGEYGEERIIPPGNLPSIPETFREFKSLWFERDLLKNTLVTIKRVGIGFALATIVGVPLGVLAGCFGAINAFLAPLVVFGRNIPIAALAGVSYALFGAGEEQKILFIFFACVAFIIADTAISIRDVGQNYVDTAYTLGATRWQAMIKVLVPLALPSVFNSLRVLFGLAFGYIMLAEAIKFGNEFGGIGNLILNSTRRGPREHIFLIILLVPVLAVVIDRVLYLVQRSLFPHQYGGRGVLNQVVYDSVYVWELAKGLIFPPNRSFDPPADNAGGPTA
jgi:ABC-type nitrate/sulfonate/bicarbonate transport system permease component